MRVIRVAVKGGPGGGGGAAPAAQLGQRPPPGKSKRKAKKIKIKAAGPASDSDGGGDSGSESSDVEKEQTHQQNRMFTDLFRHLLDGDAQAPAQPDVPLAGLVRYEPVPLHQSGKRVRRCGPNCFGCNFGFKRPDNGIEDPQMYELWTTFFDNRNFMSRKQLHQLISDTQYELYVQPFETCDLGDYKPAPHWTPEEVEIHLEDCRIFELSLQDDYDDLCEAAESLRDQMVRREERTGDKIWDKDYHDMWTKTLKMKQDTWLKIEKRRKAT